MMNKFGLFKHNYLMQFFGVAFCVLGLIGCASTSGVVGEVKSERDGVVEENIEIQNRVLAQKLEITNFRSRIVGGILQAQVTVENRFSSDQQFQYKFAWFDSNGFQVEPESEGWEALVLHGKETRTLNAVAPNPTVKSFKVVLRSL